MRYEYGWQRVAPGGTAGLGNVEPQPTKRLAEDAARDWVISPLRTGPRRSRTLRRVLIKATTFDGYTGTLPGRWETLDTWSTPESLR